MIMQYVDWVQASCGGRMGRKNFIFLSLIIFGIEKLLEHLLFIPLGSIFGVIGMTLAWVFSLFFFFSVIHVVIRRLHDLGLPWWMSFGLFFPYLGFLMVICLMVFPGVPEDGPNIHGAPESEGRLLRDVFFYGHA